MAIILALKDQRAAAVLLQIPTALVLFLFFYCFRTELVLSKQTKKELPICTYFKEYRQFVFDLDLICLS